MTPLQLERLAELVNGRDWRWSARRIKPKDEGCHGLVFKGNDSKGTVIFALGLPRNGDALEWMLDRLEELDFLNLRLIFNGLGRINPDGSQVDRYYISVGAASEIKKPFAEGPTRAECCALALLAALESEHG